MREQNGQNCKQFRYRIILIQHYIRMDQGLIYCGNQWSSPFCVTQRKLIETIVAIILIIIIVIQFILGIRMKGTCYFGFTQTIQTLMLLSLICNVIFSLNRQLPWFYYLQSLFYDWYFCTLVFYVTYRIVQKSTPQSPLKLRILKIAYAAIILGFFGIFIYSGIDKILECKQIWFLIIDIVGLVICSVMVQIGYQHHKVQIQKLMDFRNEGQINNPLSRMWSLIIINLVCQLTQLTQSLIFLIQADEMHCRFSTIQVVDLAIKLVFSLFSVHMSFICTIIIFHLRRVKQRQYSYSQEKSRAMTMDQGNNMIQLSPTTRSHGISDLSPPYSAI